ncbi:MAG: hypothetical protein F4Y60_09660 [Boseongicola sp. SB0664_bin_43]|uniref:Uncharacterized protein n=1 Tax=Boseongicola sp. SB0664_bin_43 TaxID=2604844 RepID=A0A6B0Y5D9_9RHOB|nr:hypothetical protein [Boseongicola sp. SB0664_bin_43]
MSSDDLQIMFTGIRWTQAKLPFGCPVFYTGDSRTWPKFVLNGTAIEGHADCDAAAAIQVDNCTGRIGVIAHLPVFVERLVFILQEEAHVFVKTVPINEFGFDCCEGSISIHLNLPDFADSFTLIKQINSIHNMIS